MVQNPVVNKKVRGTKTIEYNGIKFKSTLECNCYKLLEKSGLNFAHESEKFDLWQGFKPEIEIWAPSKVKGNSFKLTKFMEQQTRTYVKITYTPDFVVTKGKYKIYMDSKGHPNDVFPYKRKMFIKQLQQTEDEFTYVYMEPHNLRQMQQAIDIINSYE